MPAARTGSRGPRRGRVTPCQPAAGVDPHGARPCPAALAKHRRPQSLDESWHQTARRVRPTAVPVSAVPTDLAQFALLFRPLLVGACSVQSSPIVCWGQPVVRVRCGAAPDRRTATAWDVVTGPALRERSSVALDARRTPLRLASASSWCCRSRWRPSPRCSCGLFTVYQIPPADRPERAQPSVRPPGDDLREPPDLRPGWSSRDGRVLRPAAFPPPAVTGCHPP